jgi:hypothetical protein
VHERGAALGAERLEGRLPVVAGRRDDRAGHHAGRTARARGRRAVELQQPVTQPGVELEELSDSAGAGGAGVGVDGQGLALGTGQALTGAVDQAQHQRAALLVVARADAEDDLAAERQHRGGDQRLGVLHRPAEPLGELGHRLAVHDARPQGGTTLGAEGGPGGSPRVGGGRLAHTRFNARTRAR